MHSAGDQLAHSANAKNCKRMNRDNRVPPHLRPYIRSREIVPAPHASPANAVSHVHAVASSIVIPRRTLLTEAYDAS